MTYGAMSKEPLTLPNGLLIFKNIKSYGFWMTKWYSHHSLEAKKDMVDRLFEYHKQGSFKLSAYEMVNVGDDDFSLKLQQAIANSSARKQILKF